MMRWNLIMIISRQNEWQACRKGTGMKDLTRSMYSLGTPTWFPLICGCDPGQMRSDPRHIDLLLTSANQEKRLGHQYCALSMSPWTLLWLLPLVSCKWVALIKDIVFLLTTDKISFSFKFLWLLIHSLFYGFYYIFKQILGHTWQRRVILSLIVLDNPTSDNILYHHTVDF